MLGLIEEQDLVCLRQERRPDEAAGRSDQINLQKVKNVFRQQKGMTVSCRGSGVRMVNGKTELGNFHTHQKIITRPAKSNGCTQID